MELQRCRQLFIQYCTSERGLSSNSIDAYILDLSQFAGFAAAHKIINIEQIDKSILLSFISFLELKGYKFASMKRKVASLRSFFSYLEFEEIIESNPFHKIRFRGKKENRIPKIISRHELARLFAAIQNELSTADTGSKKYQLLIRDHAIIELLFATGVRVSELCSICYQDVRLIDRTILIHGKGRKKRVVPIPSETAVGALSSMLSSYSELISSQRIFRNRFGKPMTDQAVRWIIRKHCQAAGIKTRITPHMFRHTVATMLLENGADIRIIQKLLGHSSISVTEIYTQVNIQPQQEILTRLHPRQTIL